MPILGGYTSTSCMNILHNQAMICIIKVSYWGAFPNSARLFCIYIIVALHIFPNFDFFSRPYLSLEICVLMRGAIHLEYLTVGFDTA